MNTVKNPRPSPLAAVAAVALALAGTATAATNLVSGSINAAASWSSGLPSNTSVGTITVDGTHTTNGTFSYGGSSIVNHSAGTISSTGTLGFNMGGGTWKMTGGKILSRYVLANGASSVINFSGGTFELADVTGNQDVGVTNGATMNISGSATIDGTHASKAIPVGGTINFNTNWAGSWKWSFYTGTDWRTLCTTNSGMKLNGVSITEEMFDANFTVSPDGQTLSLTNPVQPTAFVSGEMLTPANWTSGLPVKPLHFGTTAVDGTYSDGNTPTADWKLTMTAGTITAPQNWHFSGESDILIQGGTLAVTGDIASSDIDCHLTFEGGTVTWGGDFMPSIKPDGEVAGYITITGGTFTGTATPATTFGNNAGGAMTITGGTITASNIDFGDAFESKIGGSAVLSGDTATFTELDIQTNWTGSFTVAAFSGDDWKDELTNGNVTFGGSILEAPYFDANFTVTNDGKTLRYTPVSTFLGGDILLAASWTNQRPTGLVQGLINVDGTIPTSLFGFGTGTIINMTGGTLTSAGTEGFNLRSGGIWNMSGGKIVSRYFIANSEVGQGVINVSGGTVELADVTGNQDMGVANGGTMNISGSAFLDATHANKVFQTAGTINISSNWTGKWIYGFFTGYDWENMFLSGAIKLDGNVLDLAGFQANFAVSEDGKTLQRGTGGTPAPSIPPSIIAVGFNPSGDFEIQALNLDPAKSYQLHRGPGLQALPDTVGAPVTGVAQHLFTDSEPPANKAFYRLVEQ